MEEQCKATNQDSTHVDLGPVSNGRADLARTCLSMASHIPVWFQKAIHHPSKDILPGYNTPTLPTPTPQTTHHHHPKKPRAHLLPALNVIAPSETHTAPPPIDVLSLKPPPPTSPLHRPLQHAVHPRARPCTRVSPAILSESECRTPDRKKKGTRRKKRRRGGGGTG